MPLQIGRLLDAVVAGAAALRGPLRDHVGHLFERPAVVRHEAEPAAELEHLLDAGMGQQVGEEAHVRIAQDGFVVVARSRRAKTAAIAAT